MTLYDKIEQAIRQHEETIHVDENVQESEVRHTIRRVMRDNPDIFWYVHQYYYNYEGKIIFFRYQFSKERSKLIQQSICDVIENDFQIEYVQTLDVREQVMYVYKWLLTYCNYNINSAYNQTIDSVFVRRNSVCTGYAKAAQYLFQLLDIESHLVFGKLKYNKDRGRHCWNIVIIDNQPYHLDVCLGDVLFEEVLKQSGVSEVLHYEEFVYNCFCVSTNVILKSHIIEDSNTLPICDRKFQTTEIERLSHIKLRKRTENAGCLLTPIGSSADIYLCAKNKNVVLKKFRERDNDNCVREYDFMDELRGCEHVLQLNDEYTDLSKNVIAIEQSTPIVDLFCSHYFHPTLQDIIVMIRDITIGWQECYKCGILYRDIHVCNIYRTNSGVYKLGDFGSCTYEFQELRERIGSLWFMSPETYINGRFDERSAVYSIVAVLYYILNELRPPFFNGKNEEEALVKKMSGEILPLPSLLQYFPKEISDEIMRLLILGGCAYYPSKRFRLSRFLLLNINALLHTIEGYNIELRFKQQYPDEFFNNYSLNVDVQLDVPHRFALNEEVELIARSINCRYEDIERMATTPVPSVIDIDGNNAIDEEICWNNLSNDNQDELTFDVRVDDTYYPNTENVEKCCNTQRLTYNKKKVNLWMKFLSVFRKRELYNNVFSSIFAPAEIQCNSHMLVQVYLHLYEEIQKVKTLAQESDKNAERRDYIPLQCKLKKGDKVDVSLNIYGETLLMSDKKSVVWQGSFTKCSFDYFVPKDIDVDELSCMALLSVNEIPVGEMRFITKIVESPRKLNPEIIAHKYNKVFISYAHKDEAKVKSFHEGLKLAGIEHFFDRAYLKTGDIFPQVIQDYINSADLFVLFWSENAALSDYVQKERTQALERAFPQVKPQQAAKLSIYPMSIEPRAELPSDMKENYHFGEL